MSERDDLFEQAYYIPAIHEEQAKARIRRGPNPEGLIVHAIIPIPTDSDSFKPLRCSWCKRVHECALNPNCHLHNGHGGDRCNTYDPDGHP